MDQPAKKPDCNPIEHLRGELVIVGDMMDNLHRGWVICHMPCIINSLDPRRTSAMLSGQHTSDAQGPLLLTWFNFNPSMDK